MPVLDPIKPNILPIQDIRELGATLFITNAYLMYRKPEVRDRALRLGIHNYLDCSGPIMTDSGAFQLMTYGRVDVTNSEITQFQERIGVDIGVFLDVPVAHGTNESLGRAVIETIERAKEHILVRESETSVAWVGPLQGATNQVAFTQCCNFMSSADFQIHAIGSVVPLMEKYDYTNVVRLMLQSKGLVPYSRPIHLFGAGHPMFFALASFCGMDLYDSAAYALFAEKDRYLSVHGTFDLNELQEFPCFCRYCQDLNPEEAKNLEKNERSRFLAGHNLAASFGELRTVKQAIHDGRLTNLVLQRAQAHPLLGRATKLLFDGKYEKLLEEATSLSLNKARFYVHPWMTNDPLILRYQHRVLERFHPLRRTLIIKDRNTKIPAAVSADIIEIDPLLGVIPQVLRALFPLVQRESIDFPMSEKAQETYELFLAKNAGRFERVITLVRGRGASRAENDLLGTLPTGDSIRLDERVASMIAFQYPIADLKDLLPLDVTLSRKSGRLQSFGRDGKLFGVIRASDGITIPQMELNAILHHKIPYPQSRVVVADDAVPYVEDGKSVFCKFVSEIDPNLRVGDEVLIVSGEDHLLSSGTLLLTPREVSQFAKGIAIRVRHKKVS